MKNKKRIELISIVDDDSVYTFTMQMIAQTLKIADKIMFFKHGKEALEYLTRHLPHTQKLPDLILLDMNMPVMDGWAFLEKFSEIKPSIRKEITIYMVSSSVNGKDIKKAQSLSALSGYVIKPIDTVNLGKLLEGYYEDRFGVFPN